MNFQVAEIVSQMAELGVASWMDFQVEAAEVDVVNFHVTAVEDAEVEFAYWMNFQVALELEKVVNFQNAVAFWMNFQAPEETAVASWAPLQAAVMEVVNFQTAVVDAASWLNFQASEVAPWMNFQVTAVEFQTDVVDASCQAASWVAAVVEVGDSQTAEEVVIGKVL